MTDTANELARAKAAINLATELARLAEAVQMVGLSIPGEPAWLLERDEKAANERALSKKLHDNLPAILAALKAAETPLPDVAGLVEWLRAFGLSPLCTIEENDRLRETADALEAQARQIAERDAALLQIAERAESLKAGTDDWFELAEFSVVARGALEGNHD